jgi:hypothetical protein
MEAVRIAVAERLRIMAEAAAVPPLLAVEAVEVDIVAEAAAVEAAAATLPQADTEATANSHEMKTPLGKRAAFLLK